MKARHKQEYPVVDTKSVPRRWQRLPIAFPVFIHGTGEDGKPCLEFATALNVSAGGMLLAVKRPLNEKKLTLEMPVPPGLTGPSPHSYRMLEGTVVRSQPGESCIYLGLQFTRPLPVDQKTI